MDLTKLRNHTGSHAKMTVIVKTKMQKIIGLVCICLYLPGLVKTAAPLTCLFCPDATQPSKCLTIERCGPKSSCYVGMVVTEQGFIRFKLGCMDTVTCHSRGLLPSSTVVGRGIGSQKHVPGPGDIRRPNRALSSVEHCCNTTLCNDGLPAPTPVPTTTTAKPATPVPISVKPVCQDKPHVDCHTLDIFWHVCKSKTSAAACLKHCGFCH